MRTDALELWTVYNRPKDAPSHYVARKWIVHTGAYYQTDSIIVSQTLEAVRTQLAERGLTPLARSPDDDPVIIETWL